MSIGVYDLRYDASRNVSLALVKNTEYDDKTYFRKAETVYKMIRKLFLVESLVEEHMYLMCLDTKMRVRGIFDVTHGTVDSTQVNVKGIFQRALLSGAVQIILLHNHPSGEVEPSYEDKIMYKRVKEAARLLEIQFIDNIIMGSDDYYSFSEMGDME